MPVLWFLETECCSWVAVSSAGMRWWRRIGDASQLTAAKYLPKWRYYGVHQLVTIIKFWMRQYRAVSPFYSKCAEYVHQTPVGRLIGVNTVGQWQLNSSVCLSWIYWLDWFSLEVWPCHFRELNTVWQCRLSVANIVNILNTWKIDVWRR